MNVSELIHPWITISGQSILKQPFFELTDFTKWNNEMGKFYERVNETKDERSFVLLMALIVEFHFDSIIRAFFPRNKEILENKDLTLSLKINILKSLKLLPESIFKFADLVRKIRNEFAHNIEIDKIIELNDYTKGKNLINQLNNFCHQYKDYLIYSKYEQNNYREKFKDITNFVNNALREYEPSVRLLREEIEKKEFLQKIIKSKKFKIRYE
jgi:hypothetical protein